MNIVFEEIYKTIWKEVFPNIEPIEIDKFKELFAFDIEVPKKYFCDRTRKEVFALERYKFPRMVHEDGVRDVEEKSIDNFKNLQDLTMQMKSMAVFRGSRMSNSEVVEESDSIYTSNYVFNSQNISASQKILFCEHCFQSEYLLASRSSGSSSFGIRINDCFQVSNSFDVDWSGNTTNCYFIHNANDLRDCMFCFNVRSKQYCIGNKQYTKEKYFELKEKILKEYFEQLSSKNPFVTLKDL